jgi:peroxiredoxin (alkyl hydroperoxide reductase subunit C)
MSLINTVIKPFKATAYHNGKFVEVTDQSLKGKWSVVFFYPADFTFVCPTELGDLADHYATLQSLGVEVYGVSTDTHFINPEGVIKLCEIHDNGIGRDAKELLRKVQAAQYVAKNPGQVCPAKWTPGAETLKPSLDLVGKI